MDAIDARPTRNNEEWLIVMSTDHSGAGYGHGGVDESRNIWFIARGDGLKQNYEIPED